MKALLAGDFYSGESGKMSYYPYRRSQGFRMDLVLWLITINAVMFVFTALASMMGKVSLVSLLGVRGASYTSQPWTVFTAMWLHGGIWHILGNMITLQFFGSYLTKLVGNRKFLTVYLIGGIAGNLLFVLLAPPMVTAIGASGAVFAVGGALAIMRPKVPVFVFPIPAPIPLIGAVIGGFIILSFIPGIAWEAHLGGLVVGLIAGWFFRRREHAPYVIR
jgi:membrane associated rhomboid family serine protease